MTESRFAEHNRKSVGDSAVDGLLGGVVSGVLMAIYLVIAGLIGGEAPGTVLSRFTPDGNGSALLGGLAHLAVSAVYGAVFALALAQINRIWPSTRRLSWLLGAAYGMVLWLSAELIILPATDSPLQQISAIHFGIAHLVYGLFLGLVIGRISRSD